jgi:hypothetical protein
MKRFIRTLARGRFVYFVCIAELALQAVAFGRYVYLKRQVYVNPEYMGNWYLSDPKNSWWRTENQSLTPVYHPLQGIFFRDIHTPNINIDASGMRHTSNNPPEGTGGDVSVFMYGGSSMAGYAVKDGETIPSYMAKILNGGNRRYRLSNFGQIAYNSNQELALLIRHLKEGNVPDIVLFYDGCNEVMTALESGQGGLHFINGEAKYARAMGPLTAFFRQDFPNHSLISRSVWERVAVFAADHVGLVYYPLKLAEKTQRLLFPVPPEDTAAILRIQDRNLELAAENYARNAAMIGALARQYGFSYRLIWQPLEPNKKLTGREQTDINLTRHPVNLPLIATASSRLRNAPPAQFTDLSGIFDSFSDSSLFFDTCHVTPQANRIIADTLVTAVRQAVAEERP